MSGQLIRQSAFSIQGKSSFVNKAKAFSLLTCLGFSACSSPPLAARPDASSQPVARISNSAQKLEDKRPVHKFAATSHPALALASSRKAPPTEIPASTASLVAASMGSSYQILKVNTDTLSVCREPRAAKITSSLFEEAIVLAKIRSALKQELPPKKHILYEVQFNEGTAALTLRTDTDVKTITAAIIKILGISGVNRVDATFPSPPPTALKK